MAKTRQKTKLELRLEPGDPGREIVADIRPVLSRQAGRKARFRLLLRSEADVPAAVNRKRVLLEKSFTVRDSLHTFRFRCPPDLYSFVGEKIRMFVSGHLYVNEARVKDTKLGKRLEVPFDRGDDHLQEDPGEVLSPDDQWTYSAQWSALRLEQKRKIYLHWASLPFTLGLMIYLGSQAELDPVLIRSRGIGGVDWWGVFLFIAGICWCLYASIGVVNRAFRDWLVPRKGRPPLIVPGGSDEKRIHPATRSTIADWLKGTVGTDTRNLRLRVVAANIENYKCKIYVTDSEGRTRERTETCRHPCRAVVLYDREFDEISAGTGFESVFTDPLDFSPVFTDLYPPQVIGSARGRRGRRRVPTHGVSLRLEFQLLHPERLDKVLAWDRPSLFAAAPFLNQPVRELAGKDAGGDAVPPPPPPDEGV